MFKRPRDLLQEHLDARQPAHLKKQAIPAGQQATDMGQPAPAQPGQVPAPLVLRCLQWCSRHIDALHHCWTHAMAFVVCVLVFNPSFGWANLVVVPVQVVLLAPVIALGELPVMLGLSATWAVGSALWEKMGASND